MRIVATKKAPWPAVSLAALACAAALAALLTLPLLAKAAEAGSGLSQVVRTFANPFTGVVEDKADKSNYALGQSMVEGTVCDYAFVERTAAGDVYATLRLRQADNIGETKFSYAPSADVPFADTVSERVQTGSQELNGSTMVTGDWRVRVGSPTDTLRVSMYVEPMGRSVVYFVQLQDFTPGTQDGEQPFALVASSEQPSDRHQPVHEYDAQGRETSALSAGAQPGAQPDPDANMLLAIVCALGAVVVVGGVALCLACRRSKRADVRTDDAGAGDSASPDGQTSPDGPDAKAQ